MKTICFFAVLLFFTVSVKAQINYLNPPLSPNLKNDFLGNQNMLPITPVHRFNPYDILRLPQNSMPCLVPDVSSIAAMPVLKTIPPYQAIPNPYFTYNNSPEGTAYSLPR